MACFVIFVAMVEIINRKIFVLLMGLCLCMQVLALMPHHHHGEDERPCINLIHCIGDTYVHECAANEPPSLADRQEEEENHNHGTKDGKCSINKIDVLRVDREDVRNNLDILLHLVFIVGSEGDSCGHCYLDNILELNIKQNPDVTPVHVAYIAVAMPPRAPSFTA